MDCFICGGEMTRYFIKNWVWGGKQLTGDFVRCSNCGMVINKTMYDMPVHEWTKLNEELHSGYQGTDEMKDDPRWLDRINAQVEVILQLYQLDVFPVTGKCIDYGCGDGKLADCVNRKQQLILKYDKYMGRGKEGYISESEVKAGEFEVVICCSVLEHLIGKIEVDKVFNLISGKGVLCLHTLVCEEIPQDPDWFYLLTVHCTLWTNKAMGILYQNNEFVGCAYNLEAQMWFMFRNKEQFQKLKNVKQELKGTWFFSDIFVDYWKEKPYRRVEGE